MKRLLTLLVGLTSLATATADPRAVAISINTFGLDLHRRLAAAGGTLVTSPWSIESALAMTWAGACRRMGLRCMRGLPAWQPISQRSPKKVRSA